MRWPSLEAPTLGWLVVGAMSCALALAGQSCWMTAQARLDLAEIRELRRERARWLPVTMPDGTPAWHAPTHPEDAGHDTVSVPRKSR